LNPPTFVQKKDILSACITLESEYLEALPAVKN
jgi:hypothetical protein